MSIHENIKDILIKHKGKENGIKAPDLAEMVDIDAGPSGINIRTKILETIKMYEMPIAGNPAVGYFYIETPEELRDYINSLDSRIKEITDRKTRIYYYYYKKHPDDDDNLIAPSGMDSTKLVNPNLEIESLKEVNRMHQGNATKLILLLQDWNIHHHKPLKSYVIERLVEKILMVGRML